MKETRYEKFIRLTQKANNLIEDSRTSKQTILATGNTPEIFLDNDIKTKLDRIKKIFYIDQPYTHIYNSLAVKIADFSAINHDKNNMAIGIRWLSAKNDKGKNLINHESILTREDTTSCYIEHINGVIFGHTISDQNISLKDKRKVNEVICVEGEVIISFSPGYEKCTVTKEDEGIEKNFDKCKYIIDTFSTHHISLSLSPENIRNIRIEAYNAQGERLKNIGWTSFPVFKDNKLATDFSEHDLPKNDEIKKHAYCFSFHGEIEHAEIYFKCKRQKHWLPIKTANLIPEDDSWDFYKTIKNGIADDFNVLSQFSSMSKDEILKETNCTLDIEQFLMDADDLSVSVNLPSITNSVFAYCEFSHVKLKSSFLIPGKSLNYTHYGDTIGDFSYQNNDNDDSFDDDVIDKSALKLILNKSKITAKLTVNYPLNAKWVRAQGAKTTLENGQHVIIEGGMVSYYKTKDTLISNQSKKSHNHSLIRAFDKQGRKLRLKKVDESIIGEKLIRFGFLGEIDYIEIALFEQWFNFNKKISLLYNPTSQLEQVNDFFGEVADMMDHQN